MVASERLRRELDDIERRIEDLQEVRYQVEADFNAVREGAGWTRTVSVFLLRRDLTRRIQALKLQRDVARNCYAETRKYEERLRLAERDKPRRVVA